MKWIFNDQKIKNGFESAFPYLDFNVTDQWYNLSSFGDLVQEMNQYKTLQPSGHYYLDLSNSFLSYLSNVFIPNHFDLTGEDIILPSLVFFLNNTTFTINWNGAPLPVAGVGGLGYQLQGLTPQRYLSDNGTHLRGFSDVILHEVGHSLGLPHPFDNYDNWAGDFVASVMGYYTSAPNFSQYDINAMGYYHSSSVLIQAEYVQSQNKVDDPLISSIDNWIEIAKQSQNNWDFNKSIVYSNLALCGYAHLYNVSDSHCSDTSTSIIDSVNHSSNPNASNTSTTKSPFEILPVVVALILPIIRKSRKR